MTIFTMIKSAVVSLRRNPLRLVLTMLGIIIGVASVIAMLAIGEGSNQNIKANIASLGTNAITIYPGSSAMGGVRMGAGSTSTLTHDDADAVAQRCTLVSDVAPVVQRSSQVIVASHNWRTLIVGSTTAYFRVRNLALESGVLYSESDERSAAKVCIVGQTVITNLFGEGAQPVGQFLRINSIPFRIIGTIERKGQNTFGQDQDDIIIAPFSTVQKRMLSTTYINSILGSAISEDKVDDAKSQITTIMRDQHRIKVGDDDDFSVRSQSDIANIFGSISRIMTILLASIAAISLVVGGIGIMNIMLVSVTERTREIGIRMAVGAKGSDIMTQFMIESIVMSFFGGVIGIILGLVAAQLVATFGNWPVVVTIQSMLLSFLFSTIIGVFFGWYPARKASRLNPIDALRYE